jgi:uncharacterized protein YlaN (UPF0358 family)
MADVTKNPRFTTQQQINEENERRKTSIAEILKTKNAAAIRILIQCSLDASIGTPQTPMRGEILYLQPDYLVSDSDFAEYYRLIEIRNNAEMARARGFPADSASTAATEQAINRILSRGSDYIRACVTRAADWACVPAAMVAAVLQNENGQGAGWFKQRGQIAERNIQRLIGMGSTGFGNVKPETLREVTAKVEKFYKRSFLGANVRNTGQNRDIQTDIFHAAAVVREGLNQAWSVGSRSLNQVENARYEYYPYFGGSVSEDAAIRAMGHYNGWGDGALKYGTDAFKRIKNQKLYFLEAR